MEQNLTGSIDRDDFGDSCKCKSTDDGVLSDKPLSDDGVLSDESLLDEILEVDIE